MAKNTIALKGRFERKERLANAAITPGHLVEIMSTGKLRVHAGLGTAAQRAFALENDLIGQGVDDAYDANDTVQYGVFAPGAEVYALLGTGESAAIGDFLESNGNGTLQVASTPVEGTHVGIALEAVTGGGSPKRCRIEIV